MTPNSNNMNNNTNSNTNNNSSNNNDKLLMAATGVTESRAIIRTESTVERLRWSFSEF